MDGHERAIQQNRQTAAHVIAGRKQQQRELARRRAELEVDEAFMGRLEERAKAAVGPPKPKATCFVCQGEVQSGRSMGVNSLITGVSVLCHSQTGQQGGCWSIMQRARATILPHCKVGPKLHDKPLGDRLLREEIDRMMATAKYQGEVAGQFDPSYSLSAKTGEQVRLSKIEIELKELRARLRGGQTGNARAQAADLAEATETVDTREAARYTDPDVEFSEGTPARPENYEGEHASENERE